MFNLFKKKPTKVVVSDKPTIKPVPKPKVPKRTCMEYRSWVYNDQYRGVLVHVRKVDDIALNLILVTHCNGNRIEPTLECVNEVHCKGIPQYDVSYIDNEMFNPDHWELIQCKAK